MRYVPIANLIARFYQTEAGKKAKDRLAAAHKQAKSRVGAKRQKYIRNNGGDKWSPIKVEFTKQLGKKCWYTEVETTGAHLDIDHFRPVCDYWWLAFNPKNYRVACSFSNSPEHNTEHGCAGGKGDQFPLLQPIQRATKNSNLHLERPVILDPCVQADCDLLAFQADGRPVLNPNFATDQIALKRVNESKLILNLDHPDFNAKREQLYHDIMDDVETYEEPNATEREKSKVLNRMRNKLSQKAPFSTAARCYLRYYQYLDWVQELLDLPE
jgi:hypothetical protein